MQENFILVSFFRKGSIIASYRLIISADKLQEAVNHIGNIEDNLVKAQIAGRKVNETYTKATMTTAVKVNTGKQAQGP